jgi:hypothetical protein
MRTHLLAATLLLATSPAFAQESDMNSTTRSTTTTQTDCARLPTAAERNACIEAHGTSGSSSTTTTPDESMSDEVQSRTTTHRETPFGSETKNSTTTTEPNGTVTNETTTTHKDPETLR